MTVMSPPWSVTVGLLVQRWVTHCIMGLPLITSNGQSNAVCPSTNLFTSVATQRRQRKTGGWWKASMTDASTKHGLDLSIPGCRPSSHSFRQVDCNTKWNTAFFKIACHEISFSRIISTKTNDWLRKRKISFIPSSYGWFLTVLKREMEKSYSALPRWSHDIHHTQHHDC